MIVEISVENLAIIERSVLQLNSGFTVLTGETGAGKSLLVDAIELALGDRADTDQVRAGAKSANVSVVFDLAASSPAEAVCEELGAETEDGCLYISREVQAEGRSQARIGGRLTPVSVLRKIGETLVDLHGQHDHQTLLQPERHVEFLDLWIGEEAHSLKTKVGETFRQWSSAYRRLEELRAGIREREHRLDLLRHQVQEIQSVAPKPGEYEEIQSQLARMQNQEKLGEQAFQSLALLSDEEGSAMERLGAAIKLVEDAAKLDSDLVELLPSFHEAAVLLDEATRGLRYYSDRLEADPKTLDELVNRLEAIRRLRRKYGDDEPAVLQFLKDAETQLLLLEDAEAGEEKLAIEVEFSHKELVSTAARLSEIRRGAALQFAKRVEEEFAELALEKARFEVELVSKSADSAGSDSVQFLFSANAGEPLRPLSRVVSGGEISRLMLALKTVLAGKAGAPTLIFDEIDTGLGGRVAATVGKKLAQLSTQYQVIAISHLPQVASQAICHYRIEKQEIDGRTVTRVVLLDQEQRVEEIAKMLGGEKLSEAALANAREMLGGC